MKAKMAFEGLRRLQIWNLDMTKVITVDWKDGSVDMRVHILLLHQKLDIVDPVKKCNLIGEKYII